jgi:3-oxoacyl-[acyl-carrier protein] reductase
MAQIAPLPCHGVSSVLGPPRDHPVLIVGGCGGIGWALCQALLAQGVQVAILDLPAALDRRDLAGVAVSAPVDLADLASIERVFTTPSLQAFGARQIVLASGFVAGLSPVREAAPALWSATMAGNLAGLAHLLACALPGLRAAGGGAVTALSTAIGQIGSPGYAAYGAAKAGLNALIRTLALEEAPLIRANAVAPGAVDTAFIRGGFAAGAEEEGPPARFSLDAYAKLVPLGRIATADDVVGPLLFLMSDTARYITGQVLHVNGGAFLRD